MTKVFISYAAKDRLIKARLTMHLLETGSPDLIVLSNDGVSSGDRSAHELELHIADADVIIMMVSPEYLDSMTYEQNLIFSKYRHGALIIPLIARTCAWESEWFGELLALPRNGKVLSGFKDYKYAYEQVSKEIVAAVRLWRNKKAMFLIDQEKNAQSGELDLSNCELTTVPADLLQMPWLGSLTLSGNLIIKIANLEKLVNLEILNISGNRIQKIENLSQLRMLALLDLSDNQITKIDNLGSLANLEVLNLSSNLINNIENLSDCTKLKSLLLSYNNITTLNNISHLQKLESLYVKHNALSSVSGLGKLPKLKKIYLAENGLTTLRPFLAMIKAGVPVIAEEGNNDVSNGIIIPYNKFVEPPLEVIEKGNDAILRFFEEGDRFGLKDFNVLKLILVGNSRAGKTNFSEFLRKKKITSNSKSTHLLDIQQWKAPLLNKNRSDLWVNIFDFGGQDYYHDAHRIFYSYDTAYVLLWEKATNIYEERSEEGERLVYENFPLEYWLESIRYNLQLRNAPAEIDGSEHNRRDQTPVLVVQNKIDLAEAPVNQKIMTSCYPNIWGFLNISLESKKRTAVLEEVLAEYIESMALSGRRLISYELPIVEHYLSANKQLNIFTLEEFRTDSLKFIKNEEVSFDTENADTLAQILNNMGLVYYNREGAESGMIFTNIPRLNDLIKHVMDLARKGNDKGVFLRAQLKGIKHQEHILALLCKNNSIIQIGEDIFLAPQFLAPRPEKHIQFFADAFKCCHVRFIYKAYFHKTLLLSLFSHYLKDVKVNVPADIKHLPFWRNGIVISRGEGENKQMVLVEFEKNSEMGKVNIRTMLPFKQRGLEREVVNTLQELNRGWTVEKEISVNGKQFFNVEELKKGLTDNQYLFFKDEQAFSINDFKDIEDFEDLPKKIFISYSSKDAEYIKRFVTHLQVLKATGKIVPWFDRMIESGTKWDETIKKEMHSSDVIVFLLSPDFLATEYIMKTEIPKAIEQLGEERSKFFFIELLPCGWERTELAQFQQTDDEEKAGKNIISIGHPGNDANWKLVIDELAGKMGI